MQLLPPRPLLPKHSGQEEEELPLIDPNRVPSPAPLEDEEFDVAAAAAAAARSDAALFPDEALKKKNKGGSSSDDDDDDGNEALARNRPTGGDGDSSTDEDEGYRGAGNSHVGSRSGFLSFVDETRELRAPARSAADEEARRRRRAEEKKQRSASAAKVAAPEQPRRGELVHAGKGQREEEEPAAAAADDDDEQKPKKAKKSSTSSSSLKPPPPPSSSFEAAGLSPSTAAHLRSLGFSRPTPVQASALPALCAGRDALVRAPTGSGKTLAYLAPIVDAISGAKAAFLASSSSSSSPYPIASRGARALGSRAIVLAPTRELALQVTDVAAALTRRYHWVVGGALYGKKFSPLFFFPCSLSLFLRKKIAFCFSCPFPLFQQ